MKTTMRTFAAVELPSDMRRSLRRAVKKLPSFSGIRWTAEDNLHLTIKFLGDIHCDRLAEMCKQLKLCVKESSPFGMEITGLHLFPSPQRIRLITAGVRENKNGESNSDQIKTLHKILENWAADFGISPERRAYTQHITVGRFRHKRGSKPGASQKSNEFEDLSERVSQLGNRSFGSFLVQNVVLFQSELQPEGPIYTPLTRAPFGNR